MRIGSFLVPPTRPHFSSLAAPASAESNDAEDSVTITVDDHGRSTLLGVGIGALSGAVVGGLLGALPHPGGAIFGIVGGIFGGIGAGAVLGISEAGKGFADSLFPNNRAIARNWENPLNVMTAIGGGAAVAGASIAIGVFANSPGLGLLIGGAAGAVVGGGFGHKAGQV